MGECWPLRDAIDNAIDREIADTGKPRMLMISTAAWPTFKAQVSFIERTRRKGLRLLREYRGIPISLHDEWSWGWSLMPAKHTPTPATESRAA